MTLRTRRETEEVGREKRGDIKEGSEKRLVRCQEILSVGGGRTLVSGNLRQGMKVYLYLFVIFLPGLH